MFAEIHKMFAEIHKMFVEIQKLFAEMHKIFAEMHKMFAEIHKMFAEMHKPFHLRPQTCDIFSITLLCSNLTLIALAKSRSVRGASHYLAFMSSCLTISHTCLPCLPSGRVSPSVPGVT